MTEVVSPRTRARAALCRPTATPVQLIRRLDAEDEAAPLTRNSARVGGWLVRGLLELDKQSAEYADKKKKMNQWLKGLTAKRSFRIFCKQYGKQMQDADAHNQRVLAEQEKQEQLKRTRERQQAASKRLKQHHDEWHKERRKRESGAQRVLFRAKVHERPMKHARKSAMMIGVRGTFRPEEKPRPHVKLA